MTRIIGIDPGSRVTGYGVIDQQGQRLHYVRTADEGAWSVRQLRRPPACHVHPHPGPLSFPLQIRRYPTGDMPE